jgi:hypothetical protein
MPESGGHLFDVILAYWCWTRSMSRSFDDERLVAGAGLLLPATLAERLVIEQGADQLVDLGDRPVAARPGRSCLPWSTPWSRRGLH